MTTVGFEPIGGAGKVVEVDETFIGRIDGQPKKRRSGTTTYKNTVFALVERGGTSRVFHVEGTTKGELQGILLAHVEPETHIVTDEGRWYLGLHRHFASHQAVNHSRYEYVRGDVHTNTVEGYRSPCAVSSKSASPTKQLVSERPYGRTAAKARKAKAAQAER
jgi:hypothetical protein